MRENRLSGLMRGGSLAVIGCKSSHSVGSCLKDRVVQMAVYLVLMPIFEADFHPRSFGFRPGRSAHQAVEEIREALRMGKTEVVDADLAKYCETIPHRQLMKRVARRVSDGMILKLIKAWLRAPVIEEADGRRPRRTLAARRKEESSRHCWPTLPASLG